jgi:isopentenyl phosphate kinase
MINLLNKILSRFNLKLVSTKPVDLIQESVKYMNTLSPEELRNDGLLPPYVGDVVYVMDKNVELPRC